MSSLPPPPTTGQTLGSLPCCLAEAVWPDLLPLLSSVELTLKVGGAFPMSLGVESDSLKASIEIAGLWDTACD